MTNFRLFQAEIVCRRQFQIDENGRKFARWVENTVEKGEIAVTSIFSFSHSVFKRLVPQTRKNKGLFGNGLRRNFWLVFLPSLASQKLCYFQMCKTSRINKNVLENGWQIQTLGDLVSGLTLCTGFFFFVRLIIGKTFQRPCLVLVIYRTYINVWTLAVTFQYNVEKGVKHQYINIDLACMWCVDSKSRQALPNTKWQNFGLAQIERNCRQHFKLQLKWKISTI